MSWELIWKLTFIIIVSLFGVMSVIVTVLGAKDVKRLIRHLDEKSREDSEK